MIKKLKAYTLIETIIAMVIIMLVFGIAMMIFIKVMKTDRVVRQAEVFFKMNEILNQSKINNEFTDVTLSFDSYEIQRTLLAYEGSEKVKQLVIVAFDMEGKQIAEKIELIIDE